MRKNDTWIPNAISLNETLYSSEDLNEVIYEYLTWIRNTPIESVDAARDESGFLKGVWRWHPASEQSPVILRTWKDWSVEEAEGSRELNTSLSGVTETVKGPWYISQSDSDIQILCPEDIVSIESPIVALSHPNLVYLPTEAVAQILAKVLPKIGVSLQERHPRNLNFKNGSDSGNLRMANLFVMRHSEHAKTVRVNRSEPTPLTFVDRLLGLYHGKIFSNGESSSRKLWTFAKWLGGKQ